MPLKFGRFALAAALAATVAVPSAAFAKHGADDGPGDDRGGDRQGQDDSGRRGGDDSGGDDSRGGDDRGRDRGVRVSGRCDRGSTAKLKVKPDDGRIEVEFEVDQNRNGVTWNVQLRRNGNIAVSTRATTRGPSGSFSVERKIAGSSGDRFSARATSPSGEVCTAATRL
ncbi:MAG TPA: hypothetical protein VLK58_06375 [Conexibacter sp.]|nr:hypothetical protein [Conexibacter sp.]